MHTQQYIIGQHELDYVFVEKDLGDMIDIYKHFHKNDQTILTQCFQPQNHVSRKHNFQLAWKMPKDGASELQMNCLHHTI